MQNTFIKLSVIATICCLARISEAQIVSCNAFLQGNYVEVGINTIGSFGTSVGAPPGYHPRSSGVPNQNICTGGACTAANILGFVADPNRTGWNPSLTGTGYYGDYFTPGEPQEGWSIESNGHESDAWNQNDGCGVTTGYTGGMTGSITSYSSGATVSATWQGMNSDGIQIIQVTSLDTANVFFTIHVTLRNTTAATVNNVYYLRTVDPDNDQTLTGGGFGTVNTIVYQLPNTLGATLISATGEVYTNVYLGLGTLDCRARCFYLTLPAGLYPLNSLDSLYNETSPTAVYTGTNSADEGIGLVFSFGSIAPGDCVTFAYAYVLKASDLTAALNSTISGWTATGDTATAIMSKDTAYVCKNILDTVSLTDTGTTSWSWISLTGETLSTYTGTHTTVSVNVTPVRLLAIGLGSGCAGANDTVYITIMPRVPTVTATSNSPVCVGSPINFTGSPGGTATTYLWTGPAGYTSSAQNPVIASAVAGDAGPYRFSEVQDGCTSDTATASVTVSTITPAAISPGGSTLCPGNRDTLRDATSGGVWTSSNTTIATVAGGLVISVATGVDTITYAISGCKATATVTVNTTMTGITPSSAAICGSSLDTLRDATTGGVWYSSNTGVATVSGGIVVPQGAGTDTITYSAGGCVATATVTVNSVYSISPSPVTICLGGSGITLTDGTTGGSWSSGNTSVATISPTGTVAPVGVGTATISYGYGGCYATEVVTVTAPIQPITPSPVTICIGVPTPLLDATTGGTWTSSNTAVATINPVTGFITGLSPGTSTIIYLTGSGSCFASTVVTVNAAPSPITGHTSVCIGSLDTLSTSVTGGTWSSSVSTVATVTSAGVVTGINAGTTIITYMLGAGCSVTLIITVNPVPAPIIAVGGSSLCSGGGTTTLEEAATGGTWTSSNTGVATIAPAGYTVTGVSAGTTIISYDGGGCFASIILTVNAAPDAILPTSTSVCMGTTSIFTDGTTGGTWSSSATTVASVVGGTIYPVGPGTATISYTVGSCSAIEGITVNTAPAALGPVGGVAFCGGTTTTLTETVTGGTWSSSNTAVGTVASGGVVTGVSAGTTAISYGIGSCLVGMVVTVTETPAAISPASTGVCLGTTTTLTDGTSGGTWSSNTTTVATVSGGTVYAVAPGTTTVSYSLGSCAVTATVSVNNAPAALGPSGTVSLCSSTTATLTETVTGGIWSSDATSVATVTSGGMVHGIAAGTADISYSIGSCNVSETVTVIAGPASLSPASARICTGTTVAISETTLGGTWSSSVTSVASVVGGTVSGLTAGTSIISYTLGSCSASEVVTVVTAPAAITPSTPVIFCSGTATTLGESATGGVWSSGATGVAVVSGGVVTGVSAGTATISYTAGACYALKTVSVSVGPSPLLPSSMTVCTGNTLDLIESVGGGTWSSSATGVATVGSSGVVGGVLAGTTYVSYSIGSCTTTDTITVITSPTAGSISGTTSLCVGANTTLADAASSGIWSSSTTTVATVSGGTVYGAGVGTTTIAYTVTSSCGVVVATHVMTVNTSPSAGTITGASSMCSGTTTPLSNTVTGGSWTASNGHASVNSATGLVTGISAGVDTITYTVTTPCGTASTTKVITVGAYFSAGAISGAAILCGGTTAPLTDGISGGTWSSSNSSATVGSTGIVTGAPAGGMDTIIYTITASCGLVTATHIIDISPAAVSGTITGVPTVCIGSSATFTETASTGTWSSRNTNATVTGGGIVTGVMAGTDIISYSVTNSCGTSVATVNVTIGGTVTAGTISGAASVCAGGPVTLTDAISGGVWSSSNTNASVSSSGVVTALASGLDTISYTITNSCGTATATFAISANSSSTPTAGSITGASGVCIGYPIGFTDAVPGGVWSMSNTHATISTSGLVSGVTAGTDTVIYTVTSSCGTAIATAVFTTGTASGSSGSITGPSVVCAGSTISLSDGMSGGTWSSSNTNATVSAGSVTGVAAGTAVISYAVTYSCGLTYVTDDITISPSSGISSIAGADTVCLGSTITLTDASPGGAWSSSNSNVSVSGGIVTGMAIGTSTVAYTVSGSCGSSSAVTTITVIAGSSVSLAPISGISIVCIGSGITLTDATPGGMWVVSNPRAAVVGAGIIDGVSPGVDTVGYMVVDVCGTYEVTKILNVDTVPVVAPITGLTTQCVGSSITLSDPTGGGIWTTSTAAVGTVSLSSGVVTGLSAGTTTITYTVTNLFGCPGSVTITDVVTPSTVTTGITGSTSVCTGAGVTLSNATAGGIWSSSNTAVATIDPVLGILTGIGPGTATIIYTLVSSCGSSFVTTTETVSGIPSVAAISGSPTGCMGSAVTLSDATGGGVWSSSNTAIATVGATTGAVTGVTTGLVTINYTVSSAGCAATAGTSIFINPAPAVDAITGTAVECAGSTTSLSDGTPGGAWISSNTTIATVDASGNVHGLRAGIDTILYEISGSGCPGIATITNVVSTVPYVFPITGAASVCAGSVIELTDTASGGAWSATNGTAIVVDGEVTGVASGMDTIHYTISNACGTIVASKAIDVVVLPVSVAAIAGKDSVCIGDRITFTDASAGGAWSVTNTSRATVTAGVLTGLRAGEDTVAYTIANACGSAHALKTIIVEVCGRTGVNQQATASDIKIYPNPASSSIHIDAPDQVNISIIGIDGRTVIEQKNATDVDISSLPNSMYMILVYDQSGMLLKTAKFAKVD